jgi:hypothetical protein
MARNRDFYNRWKYVPGSGAILLLAAKNLKADLTPRGSETEMEQFDRMAREARARISREGIKTESIPSKKESLSIGIKHSNQSFKSKSVNTEECMAVVPLVKESSSPPIKKVKQEDSDESADSEGFVTTNISLDEENAENFIFL